ncbi:hypothetical protein M5689_005397 [Euphorbia peplus]|nr:hypothetical protein M5689_005397 [Euphorbia peplus]
MTEYSPEPSDDDKSVIINKTFIIVLISEILLAGLYTIHLGYCFSPDFPKPILVINPAFVYPFDISSSSSSNCSHLSSSWNISISLIIKTNFRFICEHVQASILLDNMVVSSTPVKDLSFEYNEENKFRVNLASSNVMINRALEETLNRDKVKDGVLNLSFMLSYIGNRGGRPSLFSKWDWETTKGAVVLCENVRLIFATNSTNSPALMMDDFFCNNTMFVPIKSLNSI